MIYSVSSVFSKQKINQSIYDCSWFVMSSAFPFVYTDR